MAFPFVLATGWEAGVHGFTATSGSLIDIAHYTELARSGMTPYRGAYALRVRLNGGVTSQFLREDTAFDDLTASTTRYVRVYFYLGKDLVMADGDKFSLFEAESVLNTTTEAAFGIVRTGANINFWVNETQAAAAPSTFTLGTTTTALGRWICAEVKIVLDSGVGNDGTLTGYIDDAAMTAVATLDQGAIVDAKVGVIGPDAGTSGTILMDDLVYDDGQVFKDTLRYRQPNAFVRYTNDHPIIGRAKFAVGFTDTTDEATLSLYDSDGAPSNLEPIVVLYKTGPTAGEFIPGHDIFEVTRGLWTVISSTTGQAFISIDKGGLYGDGAVVARGQAQKTPSP